METRRKALGKGLEQLFNNETLDIEKFEKDIVESTSKKDIIEVSLSELRSNPYQPRQFFDEKALNELADSIKEHGVIQPIIIKKTIKGYEIVAGERRVKASLIAGKQNIPAIIKEFSDEEMMEISLLENIQRENLSAMEEAEAYKKIINSLGITQEEFAQKIGKSRSYVTNMLGLLRLPSEVRKMIVNKEISLGHAKILSKLENKEEILELAKRIIKEEINVRKLEEIINNRDFKKVITIKKTKINKYEDIEQILREKVGTMVKIKERKIEIPFDSEKDLERILDILKIKID